jgi:hypothetical protein
MLRMRARVFLVTVPFYPVPFPVSVSVSVSVPDLSIAIAIGIETSNQPGILRATSGLRHPTRFRWRALKDPPTVS